MKPWLILTLSLEAVIPTAFTAPLPEEARESLAELTHLARHNIQLRQHRLTLYSTKQEVNRPYAKYLVKGVCELVALEPENWLGVHFQQIEVRNQSRNQGYRLAITPKACREMLDSDLSDSELDRQYFHALQRF